VLRESRVLLAEQMRVLDLQAPFLYQSAGDISAVLLYGFKQVNLHNLISSPGT
jgi:hypothetical protein